MGNNTVITLKNEGKYSPTIYLPGGMTNFNYIESLIKLMGSRLDDLDYSIARLIGIIHDDIEGKLSLGVWSNNWEDMSKAGMLEDNHNYPDYDMGESIIFDVGEMSLDNYVDGEEFNYRWVGRDWEMRGYETEWVPATF